MRSLPLTRGLFALVDDCDFDFLSNWKWTAWDCKGRFYAARRQRENGKQKLVLMHRVIAGVSDSVQVDHWDGNSLNNQRLNLRPSTQSQNMGNRAMSKNNTSGFKGVKPVRLKSGKVKFKAVIGTGAGLLHIGVFNTAEEAARAYDLKAIEQWGQFARTNSGIKVFP